MKATVAVLSVVALMLATSPILGARFFYSADEMMSVSGAWPEGLGDLVNLPSRVAGDEGFMDTWAYYAGDSAAFNEFLRKYGAAPDTRLQIILHPGARTYTVPLSDPKETMDVDWRLHIAEYSEKRPDAKLFQGKKVLTSVDVWLGGNLQLDKLEVPISIDVMSGGEIERFVQRHETRQKEAEAQP